VELLLARLLALIIQFVAAVAVVAAQIPELLGKEALEALSLNLIPLLFWLAEMAALRAEQ
jgi:hypothetical protein